MGPDPGIKIRDLADFESPSIIASHSVGFEYQISRDAAVFRCWLSNGPACFQIIAVYGMALS
ncbi:MAG TPA: hypothetical protein DEA96_07955 [Leptospiraceae bacterium]|nr:hypothetical protein [Spirochaetaceae bacterium]HBS04881.1 hypothetical protein [Leptospiraceae bacterium]